MAKVTVRKDRETGEVETIDSLVKRFKKQVQKDDTLYECKRRQYFVKKSLARKAKSVEAIRRAKNKKRR